MPHAHDGIVLVYAPYARDSRAIETVLSGDEIAVEKVESLAALAGRLGDDVGAVVMSEEALTQKDWQPLIDAGRRQPSWSAYPFILLIGQKRSTQETQRIYGVLPSVITNVMLLERPMGSASLVSAVRWALAGRRRQFATRNHLRELEQRSRQQRLMTRELAHRVKNTIAVLQSIVSHTMRPYSETEALQKTIIERFGALSRAHDILIGTEFAAADFRKLVTNTLSVHPGTFDIEGPDVHLAPQASLSLALVLHELATNSLKYGSLRFGGKVVVQWQVQSGASPDFEVKWREIGGPPAEPPVNPGFGTRLIRSSLGSLGQVELLYEPTGFQLHFRADLTRLNHAVVPEFDQPDGLAAEVESRLAQKDR